LEIDPQRAHPSNRGAFFGFQFISGTSGKILLQECVQRLFALVDHTSKIRMEAIQQNVNGADLHSSIYQLPVRTQNKLREHFAFIIWYMAKLYVRVSIIAFVSCHGTLVTISQYT
jgi:hypothetical protein